MKKYFKVIVIAVIIGSVIAFLFYKDIKEEVKAITNKDEQIYLFQAGIFKNYDNAAYLAKSFNASIIYQENDYYRVIIGISYNIEAMQKLEAYFNDKKVEYYIKKCHINSDFIKYIKTYEEILLKSEHDQVIDNVLNTILKQFLTYN